MSPDFIARLTAIVGAEYARTDVDTCDKYGRDALQIGHPADLVLLPANVDAIAAIARACDEQRTAMVVRGAGTGYTGGAVPVLDGERLAGIFSERDVPIEGHDLIERHPAPAR